MVQSELEVPRALAAIQNLSYLYQTRAHTIGRTGKKTARHFADINFASEHPSLESKMTIMMVFSERTQSFFVNGKLDPTWVDGVVHSGPGPIFEYKMVKRCPPLVLRAFSFAKCKKVITGNLPFEYIPWILGG